MDFDPFRTVLEDNHFYFPWGKMAFQCQNKYQALHLKHWEFRAFYFAIERRTTDNILVIIIVTSLENVIQEGSCGDGST